jgi:hypothetical protein
MRSNRLESSRILLASALLAATMLASPVALWAQPAAPSSEVAAGPAADEKVSKLADDFLHYFTVGNVGLAKDNASAILAAKVEPKVLLVSFEAAANGRNVEDLVLRAQRTEELKAVATDLMAQLEAGHRDLARDVNRIKTEIERLDKSPRAYLIGKERLTSAGEYAVPFYLQYLQDASKRNLHAPITQLMGELGKPMVTPVLEMVARSDDANLRTTLVMVLGQLGYPQSAAVLKTIASDPKSTSELKTAAEKALALVNRPGVNVGDTPASLFVQLAAAHYDRKPSYSAPFDTETVNPVWYYNKGLNNVDAVLVPTAIWHNVMALRAAESALKLQPDNAEAISVWLAASLRRELQLPAGATDPTVKDGAPSTKFYAMAAGQTYLNAVLTKALSDGDSKLAAETLKALENVAGFQGLVTTQNKSVSPLVQALGSPDRTLRFMAAFALAKANPAQDFAGSFRVTSILSEAVSQTGTPVVVLIDSDEQNRNRISAILRANYTVIDAPDLTGAIEKSRNVAAFDLLIVPADLHSKVVGLTQTDYRFALVPTLLAAPAADLKAVALAIVNKTGVAKVDVAADEKTLIEAISEVKASQKTLPVDAAVASGFALDALKILGNLSKDGSTIYKVDETLPAVRDALKDKRPEIVTAAAMVLGRLTNSAAQQALAQTATGTDIADAAVKQSLYVALAESAKLLGNHLDEATVGKLITAVNSETNADVKTAAAQALGALNVVNNQASTLILGQAK